jgi:hypothetical protein
MLVAASGGRDASHTGAAHLLVVVVVMADHGHGPLKALLAPLVATFDALLGTVSGDIGQCLPIAAQGGLPASLCWVKHDRLVVDCALCGDAAQLLERAIEGVTVSALPQPSRAMFGWHARSSLVGLVVNLRFIVLSPPLPR